MSFDNVMGNLVGTIRRRVEQEAILACDLSHDRYAIGCKMLSLRTGKPLQIVCTVNRNGGHLLVRFKKSRKWLDIEDLDSEQIARLKRLRWVPKDPMHPLEALSAVFD